jgi:hypothetical protein
MTEFKKPISLNENDFTKTQIDTHLRRQLQIMISVVLP